MKFIDGTHEQYSISYDGFVTSHKNGKTRILKPYLDIHGYYRVDIYIDGKQKHMKIHKLVAAAFLPDYDPSLCVDHRDNNRINNHIDNLRMATYQQNNQNRSKRSNLTSQFKGVSYIKRDDKWRAHITHNYKYIHLGIFIDEIDAARAYNAKAIELYGVFNNINVID